MANKPNKKDDGGTDVIERPPQIDNTTEQKPTTRKPPLYRVILLNDPVTPFDLVTHICKVVFKISPEKAFMIMWTAHKDGACVVACYAKDIAETKADEGTKMGRDEGFPLTFIVEPDGDEEDGD